METNTIMVFIIILSVVHALSFKVIWEMSKRIKKLEKYIDRVNLEKNRRIKNDS